MRSDEKNKRIYTLNRLFAICAVLFSFFYASNAQLVAQVTSSGEAEVLELNWVSSNQDLSSIEIAEFKINSRWTGVELLESEYVWIEYFGEIPEAFQTEFSINKPEWRVVEVQIQMNFMLSIKCRLLKWRMVSCINLSLEWYRCFFTFIALKN